MIASRDRFSYRMVNTSKVSHGKHGIAHMFLKVKMKFNQK